MANDLPNMTRQGRKSRQEAWESGWRTAQKSWEGFQREGILDRITPEERIEYLRGIGQYFNALAHDLTQARQERQ